MTLATVNVVNGSVTVQVAGADMIAPLVAQASASAIAADLAASTALASARYFTSRALGEGGSTSGQFFSTDDGAGNLIFYKDTGSSSTEIGRAATAAGLALKANTADLIASTGGNGVGFQEPGANSVAGRKVSDALKDGALFAAAKGGLANLLTDHRTTRRPMALGPTLEVLSSPVTLSLNTPNNDVGMILRGAGWNMATPAQSSGLDGSALTTSILNLDRPFPSAVNNNSPVVLEHLAIIGGSSAKTAASSQNGISGSINCAEMNSLLVQYCGGHGIDLSHAYCTNISGGLLFGNFKNGLNLNYAFNNASVEKVRAYANGRSWTGDQANFWLFGSSNPNYASAVREIDASYSGFIAWSYALGNIASIVVSGGIAEVTTTTPHGRATGNKISVRAAAGTALSSIYGHTITVTSTTKFTFPTGAASGSYPSGAVPNIKIGVNSHGFLGIGNEGLVMDQFYCENPMGPAAYHNASKGCTLNGGFIIDGDVIIEAVTGFEIGGYIFRGESRLITSETTHRAEINVLTTNDFDATSSWSRGAWFMLDGRRYGPAIPSTGKWSFGEILWNSNPTPGSPVGWMCTASGTPGSWQPIGVTGHGFMSPVADPSGGSTIDAQARTAISAILTQLRGKTLMST